MYVVPKNGDFLGAEDTDSSDRVSIEWVPLHEGYLTADSTTYLISLSGSVKIKSEPGTMMFTFDSNGSFNGISCFTGSNEYVAVSNDDGVYTISFCKPAKVLVSTKHV